MQQHAELCKTKISFILHFNAVHLQESPRNLLRRLLGGRHWQFSHSRSLVLRCGNVQIKEGLSQDPADLLLQVSFYSKIFFPCFLVSFGCSCIETLSHLMLFLLSFPLVIVVKKSSPILPQKSLSHVSSIHLYTYPYDPKILTDPELGGTSVTWSVRRHLDHRRRPWPGQESSNQGINQGALHVDFTTSRLHLKHLKAQIDKLTYILE